MGRNPAFGAVMAPEGTIMAENDLDILEFCDAVDDYIRRAVQPLVEMLQEQQKCIDELEMTMKARIMVDDIARGFADGEEVPK